MCTFVYVMHVHTYMIRHIFSYIGLLKCIYVIIQMYVTICTYDCAGVNIHLRCISPLNAAKDTADRRFDTRNSSAPNRPTRFLWVQQSKNFQLDMMMVSNICLFNCVVLPIQPGIDDD